MPLANTITATSARIQVTAENEISCYIGAWDWCCRSEREGAEECSCEEEG